ncbi:magnesium transporter [Lysobacter enzymogenes]|uniref:magnesium transporter CorA family protein n=1 Tax=Lysobacter enzymogenes TaxID=69 RepID=UPI003398BE3F
MNASADNVISAVSESTAVVTLFRSCGNAETISLDQLGAHIDDDTLIWVEVRSDDMDILMDLTARLGVSEDLVSRLAARRRRPWIDSDGDQYAVCALAADHIGDLEFDGIPLCLLCGRNFVITLHQKPLTFLETLRDRESRRSQVGTLTADSFVASLLSWHLDTYFAAASDFESNVERLEESVLRDPANENVQGLRRLRKGASRLRRMLAPHRIIFTGMARPDFRPDACDRSEKHFRLLADQFERAMDVIENARELVIGSFELFSNQVALQTNTTMRVLTFITVVIGLQTVIAGILGMNFDAPFFKTHALGFWLAVGLMTALGVTAALLGRWRRWI